MKKITEGSVEAMSADLVAENIARIKAMFPELITEGPAGLSVNVDVLKALVGDKTVTDADEKYGLNWHGKRRARQLALTPSTGTLRPCPGESVDWEATQNLMIEGDNLEVLKLLQKSYAGKIKLIYIDPPYNTGKDFVYPDNFQDNIKNYLELTGQLEGGQRISTNTDASGRFHTEWLNMIYPRLKLARNLLRDDGFIFVSLDDNEVANLRHVLDEVFGQENFIGVITINGNPRGRDYGGIARMHDYLVVYGKTSLAELENIPDDDKEFDYEDDRGGFDLRELRNRNIAFNSENRPNLYYPFYVNPDQKDACGLHEISLDRIPGWYELYPKESQGVKTVWRWGKERAKTFLNREIMGKEMQDGGFQIVEKYREKSRMARSIWFDKDVNTEKGTLLTKKLMGEKVFQFPKPVELVMRCLDMGVRDDEIVLDFFAGSGTTGHAVLLRNAKTGQNVRYILVQLPEALSQDVPEQKVSAKYCEKLGRLPSISELTKERLRRAGEAIRAESPMFTGDVGFRAFKLDRSNIRAWNPNRNDLSASLLENQAHLLEGRTEEDVLYELLLKLGLDLCVPMEERNIAGLEVCSVGGGVLMACLAERISRNEVEPLGQGMIEWLKEMSPAGDTTLIFRDGAFVDDVTKTNLTAILEQHGIQSVRSL